MENKNPNVEVITKATFKQLTSELLSNKESKAANELAKAYFKQDPTDLENLSLLAKSFFDVKDFENSLRVLEDCYKMVSSLPLPPGQSQRDLHSLENNIAKCLYYLKRAPESLEILKKYPDKLKNTEEYKVDYSLYLNAIGKYKESYDIISKIPKNSDAVAFNSAWYEFRQGKFKEAFNLVIRGSNINVWGNENELLQIHGIGKNKRWNYGEKVKTLAFYLEGGIGDEIVFLRWYNHLKPWCSRIKIFCSKKLVNLLKECGYPDVYPHEQVREEKWDKYVPSMSSPNILKIENPRDEIDFSYLDRNSNQITILDKIAQGRKKICIKWKGNPEFEHDQFRLFPVEGLLPLSKYGQLFSLQIEDNEDLHKNAPVWDLSDEIDSWSDTYDIIADSDLVVSSCTAVAHMAATMGKKVIVLVPLVPYFIWASDDVPWYNDNVKVVRQREYNSWDSAFQELYQIVEDFLNE